MLRLLNTRLREVVKPGLWQMWGGCMKRYCWMRCWGGSKRGVFGLGGIGLIREPSNSPNTKPKN